MAHFFFKLVPPRPTFVQDMTAAERALMGEHAAYTHALFETGVVLAYGPVFDTSGSFGMGLIEVQSMEAAQQLAENDPTIKAGLNTYTLSPMLVAASQSSRQKQ